LGGRKGIQPVKKPMCCFVGGFARLIAPVVTTTTTITLSSNKVQNGDIIIIIIIQAFLRCTLSASELNLRLRQSLGGEDG